MFSMLVLSNLDSKMTILATEILLTLSFQLSAQYDGLVSYASIKREVYH